MARFPHCDAPETLIAIHDNANVALVITQPVMTDESDDMVIPRAGLAVLTDTDMADEVRYLRVQRLWLLMRQGEPPVPT